MGKGLFVVGTDTDVGKTFVTAGITHVLRKHNKNIIPFKPVQSGGETHGANLVSGDIRFIKEVAGVAEEYSKMNVYCFEDAVSPHIAAEREGAIVDPVKIKNHFDVLMNEYEYTLVEGAGGVIVPLSRDYFLYELIKDLDVPVVIVARAGVGTINHTSLTVDYLRKKDIDIKAIVLNNYTATFYEDDNMKILKEITGIEDIITLNKTVSQSNDEIRENYEKCFDIDTITKWFE